ncbi:MAG: hypothetical protein JSS04_10265 [Proteobacteria bacterium]|nr:hypothetical protein [Pseudomonadota bacterium]
MLSGVWAFLQRTGTVCLQSWQWCVQNGVLATLAMAWWGIIVIVRLLWAVRAVLVAVLPGALLIVGTDQARDIVIASGLPSEHNLKIPISLAIWAVVSWYWARISLLYAFVNPAPAGALLPRQRAWWQFWTLQIPRLLGAACIASVAWTFHEAARIYSAAGDPRGAFATAQWFYAAAVIVFYVAVASRSWVMTRLAALVGPRGAALVPDRAPLAQINSLNNRLSWIFLSATFFLAPIVWVLVKLWPVEVSARFGGAVPMVLFGLALIAPITSTLVILSARYRLPLFGAVTALLVLAPVYWSDNHDVRTCRDRIGGKARCNLTADSRMDLGEAFQKWWAVNESLTLPVDMADGNKVTAPPMVLVATAGGASRAAFWTSQVLGQIARLEDNFADRVFMISGVSGGSLGATAFRSIVEADRRRQNKPDGHGSSRLPDAAAQGQDFIENDFLGPALATGLYIDLPARTFAFLLSDAWRPDDRATALEKAWEDAWDRTGISTGEFTWKDGFYGTFGGQRPWPILVLNGTSVEMGKRIITSNVKFWSPPADAAHNLAGGINRYDTFYLTGSDIPISTAVTMSARFPVISPTGALRNGDTLWARVTDGGLFENFGAATADEVLRYLVLRRTDVQIGNRQTIPIAILISSDPALDQLGLRSDGAANRALPDCSSTNKDARARPAEHAGNGLKECPVDINRSAQLIVDPAVALYNGRVARGVAAATALHDRIRDGAIAVRDRILRKMAKAEGRDSADEGLFDRFQARFGLDDHIDFFHFRQCRVEGSRGPTMSWHDSHEAWEVMQRMLGLTKGANSGYDDPCGNQVEFFRLCVRLTRLSGAAADDRTATDACEAKGWPKPASWKCDDNAHDGKRPYCRYTG